MTEDLRLLLQSPELALEPPRTLADDVRRQAHRRRVRTRVGGAATALVLVAVGVVAAPHITGSIDDLRTRSTNASAPKIDPRAPHATSDVLTLRIVNKAEILTWFEGSQWCTKTTR